jgi:hypothetical protein
VIIFLLALWASQPSNEPRKGSLLIERPSWREGSCNWAFKGPTATSLRTIGPSFVAEKWFETEPAGQINCEILYQEFLDPPYRVLADILPMNGQGKGGLIFDEDNGNYTLFEAEARKGKEDSKLLIWRNNPFRGVATIKCFHRIQSVYFSTRRCVS